ncbi:hypothetical protein Echvi_0817 [Echinicola vietnamensis DSM 17526]|uniref:Uncharacterized protein n=1 Tax=Echinicola vietnamensis (strain DSM 17526 / LMG 23754 / KMM 6221) TaxID=926556 RepID=L0FWG9_ECHVK|nr:hypothetical protein Echvi_0817 [Echinicola vietnamensis DSM 17526]
MLKFLFYSNGFEIQVKRGTKRRTKKGTNLSHLEPVGIELNQTWFINCVRTPIKHKKLTTNDQLIV